MVDVPPDAPDAASPLPESFVGGRYRVERFLGRGGRKQVYLARDTRLDREVAVAVIPTDGLDEEGAERVRREARAMARLGDHPHIVAVYDSVEEPGAHLIVSQFMAGGDLSEMIRAAPGGRLGVEQAVAVALELCSALTHAHEHGVFHRDLKPANVFLGADGATRLGDFGLARLADNKDLTLSGSFMGTAAYMAPEQALGSGVDARSDLYALGCVLYEMVAGRPPFTGDDTVSVIGQQINAAPVPPSWHNPTVPRGVDRLVLELLSKSPSDRPTTAAAVTERLVAIDPDEPAESADADSRRGSSANLVLGRMVGRHHELAALRERIDQAVAGQGSMTLLVGEPGIGKTRLSQEAATFAGLRDTAVLWGRCYESEAALPYRPWTEILGQYVRDRPEAELRLQLGTGLEDVARLASEVGDRFGLRGADAARSEAEADRLRLFDSVVSFLVQASRAKPLLVILDDLHWADTPSLLLLQHLARRLPESRICVIGTYRDVDLDRQHPLSGVIAELRQRRLYERIRLHGFDEQELRTMLAVAGQQDESTISVPFVKALLEETEGNPFFVEETLRHLVEAGKLYRKGTQWVSDATSISDLDIPEGVREVIGRRLSRLSPSCNDALHHAAVLGRDFEFGVLQAMTQMGEDDLLVAVEEALEASIIREFRDRPGVAAYQFTHALVQQTLLEELSLPRLQRLHFRAAEAIEATPARGGPRAAAVLSAHYRAAGVGGDLEKALRYTMEAELVAEETYAWEEAVELFRAAVELMDELRRPEVEIAGYVMPILFRTGTTAVLPHAEGIRNMERCRAAFSGEPALRTPYELATVGLAAALQNGYVPEYMDIPRAESLLAEVQGDDPEVLYWRTLIQLNVELGVPRPERLAALADSVPPEAPHGAWAQVYRAASHGMLGEPQTGLDRLVSAWELSCRSRESIDGFSAHVAIAIEVVFALVDIRSPVHAARFADRELALNRQSVPRAMDISLEIAAAARERGEVVDMARLPSPEDLPEGITDQGKGFRWWIAMRDGHWSDALTAYLATLRMFGGGGAHLNAATGGLQAAEVLMLQGELDMAERILREILPHTPGVREVTVRARLGLIETLTGRHAEALAGVERCRALITGDGWGGLPGQVDLVEALALLATGARPAASARFDSAVATARQVHHPWDEAEAHLLWGQALAAEGDVPAALPHFDAAMTIYQRVHAGQPFLERAVAARLTALGQSPDADAGASVLLVSRAVRAEGPAVSVGGATDVTLLFSDIEGSTALNQRLGDDGWLEVLRAHNDVVERATAQHHGTVVKSMGDGYMLTFASPAAALRCAAAIQSHLEDAPAPLEGIRVRIGVHAGEAVSQHGDYFGLQVALAARVANAASGGETLVSEPVRERVLGSGEFTFGPGRQMSFKGIADTHSVFALARSGR